MYALTEIGKVERKARDKLFEDYDFGNVTSLLEHICLFLKPVEISDEICAIEDFLPQGKKLDQQDFNYLNKENVIKILDNAVLLDPENEK